MRTEIRPNGTITEWADEGKWLYKDFNEYVRLFETVVSYGKDNEPWPECTDAEKIAWEEEHRPQPDPELEPEEIQDAEIVE